MQITVPVAKSDVELQRLAQAQRLMQPEAQQNPILTGHRHGRASAWRFGDLRRGLVRSPSNPPSIGQDGLGYCGCAPAQYSLNAEA